MREYRGKDIESGKWRYGSLVICENGDHVIENGRRKYGYSGISSNVDPDTVGQYTGSQDKRGKGIFDGDILSVQNFLIEIAKPFHGLIVWDKYRYAIRNLNKPTYIDSFPLSNLDPFGLDLEVIGNRWDHTHLLGEGSNETR